MTCQLTEYRLNLLPVAAVALLALAALFAVIPAASAQDSAPETPGKPTAKAVFQGGVDLKWNEVPGAESYDVQLYRNRPVDRPAGRRGCNRLLRGRSHHQPTESRGL